MVFGVKHIRAALNNERGRQGQGTVFSYLSYRVKAPVRWLRLEEFGSPGTVVSSARDNDFPYNPIKYP